MTWKIGNVKIDNRIVLAPLAGVSNHTYRKIIKNMGAGLVYSEMISTMGLTHNSEKTIELMKFSEEERPISIQIFGSDTESFVEAAKYIEKYIHPDIIDINMGCPVPKVALKSQAGSSLLKDPNKIKEIVSSVVSSVNIPVTVKIRSGWDQNNINAVLVAKKIEEAGASAIAIHARTRSQGYSGKADWNIIKEVKEAVHIPVIGNGDITSIYDAENMLKYTGCDAVMIGRGALGNPWLIKQCVEYVENNKILPNPKDIEKLDMIKTHYKMLKKDTTEKQALLEIRTHALWYIKGMKDNKEIKNKITAATKEDELFNIIDEYKKKLSL